MTLFPAIFAGGGTMNGRFARKAVLSVLGLGLILTSMLSAQVPDRMHIRPALGFEYFDRTITWDTETYTSSLKSMLFTFNVEVEFMKGLFVNVVGGYSLSNFNGLVFRQLPFSADLEVGNLGGLLLGGGLKKNFVVSSEFEMDLDAQFVTYLGSTTSWPINGLNEDGTLSGKASWYRVQAGPVFWYKGFEYFSPYLRVSFDKLWGTFHVDEVIGTLAGLEDKAITGKGLFSIAVGTLFEPSSAIGVKVEAYVLPRTGGLDYGAQGKLIFTF
jgi:hypothetical protein